MKENKIYLWHYGLSFLIATTLFITIFLSAYSISYLNYKDITKTNNIINGSINELKSYLSLEKCDYSLLVNSSIILDNVGARLNLLETRFGKNDVRVIYQKELYSELEYEHFQIVKKFNSQCDSSISTVLFFYSNNENDIKRSERVGEILSILKNSYKDKLMIYSFDYNINQTVINSLIKEYNIKFAPVIVLNENNPQEVENINDIENTILQSNKA